MNKSSIPYKKTIAGRGSQLHQALVDKDQKAAARIYKDTTARFDALYPAGYREAFENWSK